MPFIFSTPLLRIKSHTFGNVSNDLPRIACESSFRKTAERLSVSESYVQKLVTQKRTEGDVVSRKQGGSVSAAMEHKAQLLALVEKHPDATLAEYCELLFDETELWVM